MAIEVLLVDVHELWTAVIYEGRRFMAENPNWMDGVNWDDDGAEMRFALIANRIRGRIRKKQPKLCEDNIHCAPDCPHLGCFRGLHGKAPKAKCDLFLLELAHHDFFIAVCTEPIKNRK